MADQERTDIPTNTGAGWGTGTGVGAQSSSEVCEHCGQPLNQSRGLEQFLGRLGISEEMISNLKSQMSNVDIEQYLDQARDYLRMANDKVQPAAEKAQRYAKENPGKIAAGVAVLAVGAGLLINSLRDRE